MFINFIFSKKQLLVSLIFSIVFFISVSFISALIFMISFILLTLGFVCSSFSGCFRCNIMLFIQDFFSFPDVNLYHSIITASAVSHRFWIIMFSFSFVSRYFLISSLFSLLILQLFSSILFRHLVFVCFAFFFFLQLISNFIALWLEKMLARTSIFLQVPRLTLQSSTCSILEDVPCAFENNVYSSSFRWNVLSISRKSIWFNVSFKVCVSLLIFCLADLSINENVLKSPTVIVILSVFA